MVNLKYSISKKDLLNLYFHSFKALLCRQIANRILRLIMQSHRNLIVILKITAAILTPIRRIRNNDIVSSEANQIDIGSVYFFFFFRAGVFGVLV